MKTFRLVKTIVLISYFDLKYSFPSSSQKVPLEAGVIQPEPIYRPEPTNEVGHLSMVRRARQQMVAFGVRRSCRRF